MIYSSPRFHREKIQHTMKPKLLVCFISTTQRTEYFTFIFTNYSENKVKQFVKYFKAVWLLPREFGFCSETTDVLVVSPDADSGKLFWHASVKQDGGRSEVER